MSGQDMGSLSSSFMMSNSEFMFSRVTCELRLRPSVSMECKGDTEQ